MRLVLHGLLSVPELHHKKHCAKQSVQGSQTEHTNYLEVGVLQWHPEVV